MTKQRLNNLFFFLGLAAVVVMLFTFDVSFVELWEHILHAGYWLIPIVGVWIIIYGINALSWQTIIKAKTSPSPSKGGESLAESDARRPSSPLGKSEGVHSGASTASPSPATP